jgi:hypothetical protein
MSAKLTLEQFAIQSTVYERTVGNYIYRLHVDSRGVYVRRVPVDSVHWSHGVICQSLNNGEFKPGVSTNVQHVTMDEALAAIEAAK